MSKSSRQSLDSIFEQFIPSGLAAQRRSRALCPDWDSLAHLQLILALEQEFDTHFSDDEAVALDSYVAAEQLLEQHGVDFE